MIPMHEPKGYPWLPLAPLATYSWEWRNSNRTRNSQEMLSKYLNATPICRNHTDHSRNRWPRSKSPLAARIGPKDSNRAVSAVVLIENLGLMRRKLRDGLHGVDPELGKDDRVFNDGSQRPQEPGQRLDEIVPFLGIGNQASTVGEISGHGEQEEQQGEACGLTC